VAEVQCPGCGLRHEDLGLPAPRGLAATGECRAESGTVLAAFYGDPELLHQRQYVVDAYAALHPDPTTRVGVQTTALCLMTMDLYLECGQPVADGSAMHQEMMRTHPQVFRPLDPPSHEGVPTHRLLLDAPHDRYGELGRPWARAVWGAWAPHHAQIRAWNELLVPRRVDSG
jgi:hypothetical protein